jgi:hypothetical protein
MKLGDRKGHSVIEVALLAPWLFFLFVGICDFGFYAHALISTENAARAAAVTAGRYSVANKAVGYSFACLAAFNEMQTMPNSTSMSSTCNAAPLVMTPTEFKDADGNDGLQIQLTYQPIAMIPIPGLLANQLTITRTVQMPFYGGN